MLKIYGSMLCKDCVKCCEDLDRAGKDYAFLDFSHALVNLKEFLKLRDGNPAFEDARRDGFIGIPCIIREDGSITLSWQEFLK